jgi:hypothetical protein
MTTETQVTGPADTTPAAPQGADPAATTPQDTTLLTDDKGTTPADTKPTESKPEDKPADTKAEDKPIEYGEFTAPEGMELDAELLGAFKTLGAELKLPQEQAQKVLDLGVKLMQKQTQAFTDMVDGWAAEAKADKEIGGDKFDENLGAAKKALDAFGNDALKQALRMSGMGNHPEVLRFMHKVGKAISEDGFVKGQPGRSAQPFYSNSKHNT